MSSENAPTGTPVECLVRLPYWLETKTFVVEYSPNCHRKWLVRLVGFRKGRIDKLAPAESGDAIGYGDTLSDAAESALSVQKHQK